MINILYFARFREALNCDSEKFELQAQHERVADVVKSLSERGEVWQNTLNKGQVLIAINQAVANFDSAISDGDELAFFPPVTGG